MQIASTMNPMTMPLIPLTDFGDLQRRYQSMPIAARAKTVLDDAGPALALAERIVSALAQNPHTETALVTIHKNTGLVSKMRASEAKNNLLDGGSEFIKISGRKLAVWRRTLERLAEGEGVLTDKKGEYISAALPIGIAAGSIGTAYSYLSIMQLVLAEMVNTDPANSFQYQSDLTKIRRCATFLSDCELASAISALIH